MVVVARRAMLSFLVLAGALLVTGPASGQDAPVFLLLGTDATGDPQFQGADHPDTWIDINSLSVATVGTDLVFHLGLEGTTTEVGSYCWMAAFEVDGEEYVGLDCYEGLAYESDNTLSQARPPSTSRGTNVASSVVFDDTGAVITIPLAAIGASPGTTIDDIYGLTYVSRALYAADTVPDAKSDVGAEESLGSYTIGGGAAGNATDAIVVAAQNITENLTAPAFLHEFANATSDDYTLDFTVAWSNVTFLRTASVASGSANVTILRNGTAVASFTVNDETHPAVAANATAGNATTGNATAGNATAGGSTAGNRTEPLPASAAANATGSAAGPLVIGGATGNWTIRIDYDGFTGTLGLNVTEYVPPADSDAALDGAGGGDARSKDSPGLAVPLLATLVLAMVALRRRLR